MVRSKGVPRRGDEAGAQNGLLKNKWTQMASLPLRTETFLGPRGRVDFNAKAQRGKAVEGGEAT